MRVLVGINWRTKGNYRRAFLVNVYLFTLKESAHMRRGEGGAQGLGGEFQVGSAEPDGGAQIHKP